MTPSGAAGHRQLTRRTTERTTVLASRRMPTLDALVRQAQQDCGTPAAMGPAALADLLERLVAAPQLWSPSVRHEPTSRWYGSLFRDDVVDLWLLTWQQDNSTDLHDHGGSSGAFPGVSGALSEFRPALGNAGDVG